MDWTATITNVTDDVPNSDLLTVSVNFTNGTDSFANDYRVHAADYPDIDSLTTFLNTELTRFVGIKDLANTFLGAVSSAQVLTTVTARVADVTLQQNDQLSNERAGGLAQPSAVTPQV